MISAIVLIAVTAVIGFGILLYIRHEDRYWPIQERELREMIVRWRIRDVEVRAKLLKEMKLRKIL